MTDPMYLTIFAVTNLGRFAPVRTVVGTYSEDPRFGAEEIETAEGIFECPPSGNWVAPDGEMITALSHRAPKCPPWRQYGTGFGADVAFR